MTTPLRVTTGDDVAFCSSLNRISGARTDGEETNVWVRATVGLRVIDGKWLIVHAHESVPFTWMAATELRSSTVLGGRQRLRDPRRPPRASNRSGPCGRQAAGIDYRLDQLAADRARYRRSPRMLRK
jgi:hypothetical protein